MRILHVINSLIAAGAENLVVTIANGQIETEEVSIFTFYSESDAFHEKLDKRVNLHRNKGPRYFSLKKLRQLNRLIKQHDVVHVHLFPPLYAVALLSLLNRKKKFFFTEHNTHNSRRKPLFWLLEKAVYSRYEKVICISDGAENELKKWLGKVETKIINNVIDKKRIAESEKYNRSDFDLKEDQRLLIMIGRFYKQKDQDTIIRALALLPKEYVLLLVGYGPRETDLRNLTNDLGLNERVRFLGARTDVFSIIGMCNYGVLSSHWEGFGLVALETMSCNVLTLGSNVEGLNEVICPEKALFEKGNEKQLAELILEVDSDTELYQQILDKQQEQIVNFDIETSLQRHFDVYNGK